MSHAENCARAELGFSEELLRYGGGRHIALGTSVELVYGSDVCGTRPLEQYDDHENETDLLPQAEPLILLEVQGGDAKVSTRTRGDVWVYLTHLRPVMARMASVLGHGLGAISTGEEPLDEPLRCREEED